jgi:[phosphatase 2A protein]-leucine-carboxy methyltransferase
VINFFNNNADKTLQIVSLGAGKDTRYFRLASEFKSIQVIYHEIDYKTITQEKIQIIKRTPELLSVIAEHSGDADDIRTNDDGQLLSPSYNLHPIDLRDIETSKLPQIPNLRPNVPTLILSECCLCYISYTHQAQILASFTQHYIPSPTPIALIIYEPIRPNDSFGRVMISNLNSRGITMQTIQKFENLTAQRKRLGEAGFSNSQNAADINFIYGKWVDKTEQQRVARCEMLDEIEEWVLLAQHYCVAWGARDADGAIFGAAWKDFPTQQDG